jgi:metallophosphoesterase (TIGR00282 family)
MKLLFIGDIVGPPGIDFLQKALPVLRRAEGIDLVVANAENAAGGSGITTKLYRRIRGSGVDLITLGDHIYKKAEIIGTLEEDDRVCKPAKFPPDAPGHEFALTTMPDSTIVAAFCVLGRQFMRPVDCPFLAADRVLKALEGRAKCVIVDAHAEATAEKYLLGHYLKGRVSAVLGTHTHVQTADEQLLAGGTAFICDVGMTGPYESVLGRRIDRVLTTTVSFVPTMFEVASGDPRIGGAIVDIDPATGKASSIRRVMLDEKGLAALRQQETPEESVPLPPVP